MITEHCFDRVFSQLNGEPEDDEPGETVSLPLLLVLKYHGPLNKYDREMLCPKHSMYGVSVYILITFDGKCRVIIPYMESVG